MNRERESSRNFPYIKYAELILIFIVYKNYLLETGELPGNRIKKILR